MSFPPRPPSFYWNIARATYKYHKLDRYIADGSVVHLQNTNINTYQVFLFRDIERNELIVGFQGTSNGDHWVQNLTQGITDRNDILKAMGKRIESWERKYHILYQAKMSAYVGHSAGGRFATHVNDGDYRIHRVTFNGFQARSGKKNWNLRSNDWLSGGVTGKACGSDPNNYIQVCWGGHGVEHFGKVINQLTWEELSKMKAKACL